MAKLAAALTVLALVACVAPPCQAGYGYPNPMPPSSPPPPAPIAPSSPPPYTPITPGAPPPTPVPGLAVGYYNKTCYRAEDIVREYVGQASKGIMAGLIRLFFHDCFVQVRNMYNYMYIVYLHMPLFNTGVVKMLG